MAGVVLRIGSDVTHVAVGDRVLGVSYGGVFTTNAVIRAPLAVRIPNQMSFEDAASMPGCFVTVIQSLIDIGQLEKGQVRNSHSRSFHLSPVQEGLVSYSHISLPW